MNKNGFSRCADIYIGRLREEGRYSTAHVYQNALLSFSKFCGVHSVSFRQVTRDRLRRYEQHLYACGLKPNTISTATSSCFRTALSRLPGERNSLYFISLPVLSLFRSAYSS